MGSEKARYFGLFRACHQFSHANMSGYNKIDDIHFSTTLSVFYIIVFLSAYSQTLRLLSALWFSVLLPYKITLKQEELCRRRINSEAEHYKIIDNISTSIISNVYIPPITINRLMNTKKNTIKKCRTLRVFICRIQIFSSIIAQIPK